MRTVSILTALSLVGAATAFLPVAKLSTASRSRELVMSAEGPISQKVKEGVAAALFSGLLLFSGSPANAITKSDLQSLSYEQVKGTGLANRCPEVVGEGSISVQGGKYKLVDLCLEPKTWQVEEEVTNKKGESKTEYINTKLMTRQTYTLDGVSGDLKVAEDGKLKFEEKDGIDYAATTVQMPGGERVPLLFTIKQLVATAAQPGSTVKPGFQFGGSFNVPSYRTGLFLDPKGRGVVTGYDQAVALPGLQNGVEGDAELFKENNKLFDISTGNIELEVNKVNAEDGEIGGVFVSSQYSDTDLGAKAPKKVLLKGVFYGRIEN